MLESAWGGMLLVFSWPAIGYLMLGVVLGLYFGAVPGLSGLVGMAILLPFTFTMDPVSAFSFLLGMFAVTTTSDTIASVLLGVPGTAASAATIVDGYPMAQQGESARAFGAAFTVSAVGGILGALALGVSIPVVRPIIMTFSSPELFMLGVLGLTMVGSLSGRSMVKGLVAAAIGLLLATVGYSIQGGLPRFDFGTTYLLNGIPLIPVVLGVFALPEIVDLAARNSSISRVSRDQVEGGLIGGMADAIRHRWLVLRCTVIGVYIGMLPGVGAGVVDWVAYGHAVQSAKDKSRFGKGDVRGVIAPEAANNAMKGGALIPTVAFGLPGNASMAILLGAFLIQGLVPGVDMLTTKLDLTFAMMWMLVIANVVGAGFLMVWAGQLAKLTFMPGHWIVPMIVLFVFMGAWMATSHIGDWYTLLFFGVVGQVMKQAGWPRPPLVLGLVLGNIMEYSLDLSFQIFDWGWTLRPAVIVIAVLIIATVVYSANRAQRDGAGLGRDEESEAGRGGVVLSIAFAVVVTAVFADAALQAIDWPADAQMFPLAVSVAALGLVMLVFLRDAVLWREYRTAGISGFQFIFGDAFESPRQLGRVGLMFLSLVGLVLASLLVGQVVSLPAFILLYLLGWARVRWWVAIVYAARGWLVLYLIFDRLIHVSWQTPILLS